MDHERTWLAEFAPTCAAMRGRPEGHGMPMLASLLQDLAVTVRELHKA